MPDWRLSDGDPTAAHAALRDHQGPAGASAPQGRPAGHRLRLREPRAASPTRRPAALLRTPLGFHRARPAQQSAPGACRCLNPRHQGLPPRYRRVTLRRAAPAGCLGQEIRARSNRVPPGHYPRASHPRVLAADCHDLPTSGIRHAEFANINRTTTKAGRPAPAAGSRPGRNPGQLCQACAASARAVKGAARPSGSERARPLTALFPASARHKKAPARLRTGRGPPSQGKKA